MTRTMNLFNCNLAKAVCRGFSLFVLLSIIGAPSLLRAQTSGTGSIEGTVTDPAGAVVPGASVSAMNTATGVSNTGTTTATGRYVLALLPPGTYNVVITSPGFSTLTQENVIVDALANVPVNAKLSIGSATESVTVTDAPSMLATEDVKLGSSIENDVYSALPLAMNQSARDPSAFIGLALGVSSFSVQAAGPSTASFNGGQTYQNETYVEGLAVTSAGTESDTRNLAFGISVDAVEQFQVAASGSEAMYEGQGVSNFIVKAGTNKFHGGIYEYFRNTIFDAKAFFANKVSVEHQNEFGGSIGGPVLKNKLFFFANYDGYRFDSAFIPTLQTIPTIAERNGDFTAFPYPIYDPTNCLTTNTSGVCTSRQQISCASVLNVICFSHISGVAKSFQSYLPTKNYDGTPLGTGISGNYLASLPNLVNNDSGTAKVDYNFAMKDRLTGIFTRGKYANPITGSLAAPGLTSNAALPIPYVDGRSVIEYATLAQIHESHVFSASVVNDFGYGMSRLFIPLTSNTANGNYPSKAGLTGLPAGIAATGFPDVTFGGSNGIPVSWGGTNSHVSTEAQTTFTAQDNILWTKGRHHFTFGYQWQALQDNDNNPTTGTLAGFTFSPNETANFNGGTASNATAINTATGISYASYLLGAVDSSGVTQNAVAETGGRYKTNATYVQDDIQVSSNLTITAGLRWDVWTPFTESENRQTFFNPSLANPVAGGRLGALQFAGNGVDGCHCATPVKTHYLNFGPRLGFAYRATPKTVVRGAYGMFYAHAGGVGGRTNGRQGLGQIGFNSGGTIGNSPTLGQPAYYWDNGYPGNPLPPPFFNPSYGIGFIDPTTPGAMAIGANATSGQTLTYGDPDKGGQAPQYQDFSFNIQQAFSPNMTLSVAYSGSVGRHLPGAAVSGQFTNQVPLQYLPLGGLLTTTYSSTSVASAAALGFTVPLPFPGYIGQIGQALRPYPQYPGLSNPWLDVGSSSYNSLQTSFNRRMSNGLTVMVNYTYSKEMDNLAGARLPGADYLENSVGTLDHKHVGSATFVYKLPFGEGHRYGSGNPVVKAAVSGWQFSGIFTASSGAPLTVTGSCTSGGILGSCYPNITPGYTGNGKTANPPAPSTALVAKTTHYYDYTAFTNPAAYTYGTIARSAPLGFFAPRTQDVDLSVRREIALYESVKLAIQADAFNLSNSVYFAGPSLALPSSPAAALTSSYGEYTTQANQPRKLQFSARLTF